MLKLVFKWKEDGYRLWLKPVTLEISWKNQNFEWKTTLNFLQPYKKFLGALNN